MSALFVADIHLGSQESVVTSNFLHFLRTRAIAAQALYILGDLFDVWIGDDDPNPLHYEIAGALQKLRQHGISCYFIHGNRDFLLGQRYADACGMTLLHTQQVMQVDGLRVVILHGDTLCTDDQEYQRFRNRVHQRWLQRLFLSLQLRLRLHIADKIRYNSLCANSLKTAEIMDVNAQAVMALMEHANAKMMIHGHTHRPAIHILPGERSRAVLGPWQYQGSVMEITARGVQLHELPFVRCQLQL